ncbi:hypothetical protein SAMN02745166_04082 [Prosthecobacter debontii]|uniref:Uncharacterized protein n=1 Tax=Prosthecobacter debontii TaxID=48467 RepID=A0A1T4YSW0_9BACT|nr:hypothetical protein [Prosthecobacter debontii]SKB04668.1 hypothetical protein SAMN02745166_04082 [Prosthecobacter debontii]
MSSYLLPLACATCRPDPGSVMAQAQDMAVLVMLGFLMLGMAAVGLIFFNFVRKQNRLSADAQL